MEIKVIESSEKAFRFMLNDVDVSYANALRRAAINSVETFAIDKITFYENTSSMFDEYIAHRIGLVPIVTPLKGYDEKDEILFTLEATGPKTVYSRDLVSPDKNVKVANENIPIMKLANEQRLRLEGKAVLGTALKHAKFQPGLATFEPKGEDKFEFYVESFGQMPPKEIINKACSKLIEGVKEIEKGVK
ncbi:MAG: DNA-directed RNA polymerase subunit D [Candidatus Micrarchaeia archaeon]